MTSFEHCNNPAVVLSLGMKEEDICDLLKLEKKQLRARIATLKTDKFIQVRMKVETGVDGKTQRVNYYYVNYKVIKFYSVFTDPNLG